MPIICPAITASDPNQYRLQMERVAPFTKRIHIDSTDGVFADRKLVGLEDVWWPHRLAADLHLMYKDPTKYMREIVQLKPHLVIVHAEAEGDFLTFAQILRKLHIKVGVAIMPKTPAEAIIPALEQIDHVMIFSGKLGHYGGEADVSLLAKAQALKHRKPNIEIGWDGGVNDSNAHLLVAGGVNVLNVGGYLQKAPKPSVAYAKLKAKLG